MPYNFQNMLYIKKNISYCSKSKNKVLENH